LLRMCRLSCDMHVHQDGRIRIEETALCSQPEQSGFHYRYPRASPWNSALRVIRPKCSIAAGAECYSALPPVSSFGGGHLGLNLPQHGDCAGDGWSGADPGQGKVPGEPVGASRVVEPPAVERMRSLDRDSRDRKALAGNGAKSCGRAVGAC